jgi:hypothetical protein
MQPVAASASTRGRGVLLQLQDEGVVGGALRITDDRHRRVVEHRVAGQQREQAASCRTGAPAVRRALRTWPASLACVYSSG